LGSLAPSEPPVVTKGTLFVQLKISLSAQRWKQILKIFREKRCHKKAELGNVNISSNGRIV
jgi:hypothetical protein